MDSLKASRRQRQDLIPSLTDHYPYLQGYRELSIWAARGEGTGTAGTGETPTLSPVLVTRGAQVDGASLMRRQLGLLALGDSVSYLAGTVVLAVILERRLSG